MQALIYEHAKNNRLGDVIRVFFQMVHREFTLDVCVLPSVFKACAGLSAPTLGRQVHSIGLTHGFGSDSFLIASLIHMYLKCDRLPDARKMFDELPRLDVVSCGAMVSGYAHKGCVDEAKGLLLKMREAGLEPNVVTWNGLISGLNQSKKPLHVAMMFKEMHSEGPQIDSVSISSTLPAVGYLRMLNLGIQIHGHVIKRGLGVEKWVLSALIDMYGRCGCGLEICKVFDGMDSVDIAACNALISGLARNGLVDNALQAFRRFQNQGINLNVVSWTSMIAACSQNGKDVEALEVFREMQIQGEKPNEVTITSLLPACGNIAALKHGKAVHCHIIRSGITGDVHVISSLVDMYAKCGRMHLSRVCFDRIPTKNLVSWNAIITGYAMHGGYEEVVEFFHLMQKKGQKPDEVTFTSLLAACSHCGMYDEGLFYFNSMSRIHGIQARMEHYACMVSLLGRCGRLEEAYTMIKDMPFDPDACVWGTFLNACRIQRNLDFGVVAAKKLFQLEPYNPGNYVLLSNIYASKGMWVEVDMIRDMMDSKKLRKNPGCSWIEIDNKIHMLIAGDTSHPQVLQINEKLSNLSMEMKKSENSALGYHDVLKHEKGQKLGGLTDKLTAVLGLINESNISPRSYKEYDDLW